MRSPICTTCPSIVLENQQRLEVRCRNLYFHSVGIRLPFAGILHITAGHHISRIRRRRFRKISDITFQISPWTSIKRVGLCCHIGSIVSLTVCQLRALTVRRWNLMTSVITSCISSGRQRRSIAKQRISNEVFLMTVILAVVRVCIKLAERISDPYSYLVAVIPSERIISVCLSIQREVMVVIVKSACVCSRKLHPLSSVRRRLDIRKRFRLRFRIFLMFCP